MPTDHNELIDFRLKKLEDAFETLSELKAIIAKWDNKFQSIGILQCPMHEMKLNQLQERVDKTEKDLDQLKVYGYKIMGGFFVVSLIVQIFGSMILDKVFHRDNTKVTHKESYGLLSDTNNAFVSNR